MLKRSKGVSGLQNEWDLLSAHFDGMRRAAVDELNTLLHESHPGKIHADMAQFNCFGSEIMDLCAKVKIHRQQLLKAAMQRMQDVMVSGRGPGSVREILELYQDFPPDLEPTRQSIRSYLDKLLGSLTMRSDQLVTGDSIEEIDDFLLSTPESDFGEALSHKLDAMRNRKKELIQSLQLDMKSAARSSDIGKVARALEASDRHVAYVGSERVELQSRVAVLVREFKSQILSLLQGSDYTLIMATMEKGSTCPPELEDDFAALRLHRGTLLEQVRARERDTALPRAPAAAILPKTDAYPRTPAAILRETDAICVAVRADPAAAARADQRGGPGPDRARARRGEAVHRGHRRRGPGECGHSPCSKYGTVRLCCWP